MKRVDKAASSLVFLLMSLGIILSHLSGALFPEFFLFLLMSVIILSVIIFHSHEISLEVVMGLILFLAVLARTYIFYLPATIVGLDPNKYTAGTLSILSSGSLDVIQSPFYDTASLFYSFSSVSALITGFPENNVLIVSPIVIGLLIPVSVGTLLNAATERSSSRVLLLGALFAAVGPLTLRYSYWPIPQSFSVPLLLLVAVVLTQLNKARSIRAYLLVLFIFLLSLSLLHKLPILVIGGIVFFTQLLGYISNIVGQTSDWEDIQPNQYIGITLLTIITVVLFTQWSIMSNLLSAAVSRSFYLTSTLFGAETSNQATNISNVMIAGGIPLNAGLGRLITHAYVVILVPIAGLSWIWLFKHKVKEVNSRVLLAAVAVTTMLVLLTMFEPRLASPGRALIYANIFMIALVAPTISLSADSVPIRKMAGIVVIIFLVSSFILSPFVVTDNHRSPRFYLTEEEYSGKLFVNEYVDKTVHTDFITKNSQFFNNRRNYQTIGTDYIDERGLQEEYGYIYHRYQVTNYFIQGRTKLSSTWWKLTWKLGHHLDSKYNKVYESGDGGLYLSLH